LIFKFDAKLHFNIVEILNYGIDIYISFGFCLDQNFSMEYGCNHLLPFREKYYSKRKYSIRLFINV